ncbi:MAG TPA: helix-turn-helix transcriptional regulator [Ktedonobacteraceae bacterium]|nr:helix-turn-helix transcriptional regulator [Ktedonobacteraceae bacterium]
MKHVPHTKLIEARKHRQWSQQEMADRLGTTQHTVSRWERGIITPGPYFRAKLCELFGKHAWELGLIKVKPSDAALPEQKASEGGHSSTYGDDTLALWTIPYPRNPHFTGRDDLLVQLDRRLSPRFRRGRRVHAAQC